MRYCCIHTLFRPFTGEMEPDTKAILQPVVICGMFLVCMAVQNISVRTEFVVR